MADDKTSFSVEKLSLELKTSIETKYNTIISGNTFDTAENFRVSCYAIFKEILDKKASYLDKAEQAKLRTAASEIINDAVNNYTKFLQKNNKKTTDAQKTALTNDPEVREIVKDKIWGAFYDGKMDPNVSAYAATNSTYSMADMVCTIEIMTNLGKRIVTTLGTLQTLSYSIYQNKTPIRAIGNMNAKDYVFGQRTIAGSLIFAVFNKHWLMDVYDELKEKGGMQNWHFLADEIPPFNVTISFANEYGFASKMAIYGLRLMNEGQTMSVNDIYIENTYQYVATDIEMLDTANSWQSTSKYNRRYQTALIGKGDTKDNKQNNFGNNMIGTDNKSLANVPKLIKPPSSPQDLISNLSTDITAFTAADIKSNTKEELIAKWRKEYLAKKATLTDIVLVKKLNKQYTSGVEAITNYYDKQNTEQGKKS